MKIISSITQRVWHTKVTTISTWIKDNSPVSSNSSEDEMTLKELRALKREFAQIKEENEILKFHIADIVDQKRLWPYLQRSRIYC